MWIGTTSCAVAFALLAASAARADAAYIPRTIHQFGIDKAGKETEVEFGLGCFLDAEDRPCSVAVSKGNTDAAAGEDFKVIRNSVVKDEFRRTVDEYTCGEGHKWIMNVEWATSNAEDASSLST